MDDDILYTEASPKNTESDIITCDQCYSKIKLKPFLNNVRLLVVLNPYKTIRDVKNYFNHLCCYSHRKKIIEYFTSKYKIRNDNNGELFIEKLIEESLH